MSKNYSHTEAKVKAREENVKLFYSLTGYNSIPADRSYWTLCNVQPPDDDRTEIVQMKNLGILSDKQFHGVDWNREVILQNRAWHPSANWHHGEWTEVLRRRKEFNPALVYLDTTNFSDHRKAAKIVAITMPLCPIVTVLLVNVMLNDPRSRRKFRPSALPNRLRFIIPPFEMKKWRDTVPSYYYNGTGHTEMITYAFFKEDE